MRVAVISKTGKPLDPTHPARARKLLKQGRAIVFKHKPIFTIQLLDREDGITHPMEYKCDTGYEHVGISICNENEEVVNEQRDLISNEPERHRTRKSLRRARRNRLRYRKSRFDNRKRKCYVYIDGKPIEIPWLAPTLRHKMEIQINLAINYSKVLPITNFIFEMGKFDTQLLKAIEKNEKLPVGTDYQHGDAYGMETLRQAVFSRDNFTCQICKKSIKDHAILHIHHIGFRLNDHTNRMDNLLTVCEKCHTPKNHQKGGKLYNLKPKIKPFKGATYMSTVRWIMYDLLQNYFGKDKVSITYGAKTKLARKSLGLEKTHSNDAYSMGELHPEKRAEFKHYQKLLRNNRILEKFYDAKYIDKRDGSIKKGSQIGSNRTNRKVPYRNDNNERKYRLKKISKGKRAIRRQHYKLRPGDIIKYNRLVYIVIGMQTNGTRVAIHLPNDLDPNSKPISVSIKKVKICCHVNAWKTI